MEHVAKFDGDRPSKRPPRLVDEKKEKEINHRRKLLWPFCHHTVAVSGGRNELSARKVVSL